MLDSPRMISLERNLYRFACVHQYAHSSTVPVVHYETLQDTIQSSVAFINGSPL